MLIETAHGHVFDHACPQWADGTLGGIGGHQGFLSRAEGCWTFDARDRTPRPSRATAHHFVENALTQTPAPSRASGFVPRRTAACAPPTAKRQQLPEAVEKRLREVCDAVHFPACQLRSGKLTDACGLSEAIRF